MNQKQVVVITGGSSGYGMETARFFVKDGGYHVIITGRNKQNLKKATEEIGTCELFAMDITKDKDWAALREYIIGKYGRLDILINNAGGGIAIKDLTEQTLDEINSSLDINLKGCILGAWTFIEDMKNEKSGTIINVSSVCAKKSWPGFSVYSAAKAGMLRFTKCLHVELQPHNIRCTCFIPAAGKTNFRVNAGLENGDGNGINAEDAGLSLYNICKMPQHVIVEEMTIWGMDQAVNPL